MNTQEQNREALIRHIADLDAVIRRRNEQIENQAHNARETRRALEEIARERDEARGALRARLGVLAEPRPLTPDAITDAMVERAVRAYATRRWNDGAEGYLTHAHNDAMREALTAALTEPPARPEGAEEWEDWLIETLPHESMPDEDIALLADQIAAHLTDPTRKEA